MGLSPVAMAAINSENVKNSDKIKFKLVKNIYVDKNLFLKLKNGLVSHLKICFFSVKNKETFYDEKGQFKRFHFKSAVSCIQ